MKKLAIAFAGLAALGFSGAASAEDATTGAWSATSTPVTTSAPTAMSDTEMDGVTAGTGSPGYGLNRATVMSDGASSVASPPSTAGQSGVIPGLGKATAPGLVD